MVQKINLHFLLDLAEYLKYSCISIFAIFFFFLLVLKIGQQNVLTHFKLRVSEFFRGYGNGKLG